MKKNDAKNAPIVFKNGVKTRVVLNDINVFTAVAVILEKDLN